MKWGEVYRTREKTALRGYKAGFYVVVSRDFVAQNDDISTVICAPVYSEVLGLTTEVLVGPDDGVSRDSAVRCDFLTLMFKRKLTTLAGALSDAKRHELKDALVHALQLKP